MRRVLFILAMVGCLSMGWSAVSSHHHDVHAAACKTTGKCNACSSCNYCKPCAKQGKKCSVCR